MNDILSNVKKDLYALVIDDEAQVSGFVAQICVRKGGRSVKREPPNKRLKC
jgi:hypothetical protein